MSHFLRVFPRREIFSAVLSVLFWHVIVFELLDEVSVLMVSGSVLNSPLVTVSIVEGPAPQMKSCPISGSFVVHSLLVGIVFPGYGRFYIDVVDWFYIVP